MKIAFDEHVPPGLVKVFQTLAADRQIRRTIGTTKLPKDLVVVRAKDYAPDPLDDDYISKSDVPWIERFAKDGGKFIISGDTRMLDVPHELRALQDQGMVTIFFDSVWNQSGFFEKCALILKHWELIIVSFKTTPSPASLKLPTAWLRLEKLTVIDAPKGQIQAKSRRHSGNARGKTARGKPDREATQVSGQGTLTLASSKPHDEPGQ